MSEVTYNCSVSPFLLNCHSSHWISVSLHSNQAELAGPSGWEVNSLFLSGSTLHAGELEDIILSSRFDTSNISLEGLGDPLFLFPVLSQPAVSECHNPESDVLSFSISILPRKFKEVRSLWWGVSCFTQRSVKENSLICQQAPTACNSASSLPFVVINLIFQSYEKCFWRVFPELSLSSHKVSLSRNPIWWTLRVNSVRLQMCCSGTHGSEILQTEGLKV